MSTPVSFKADKPSVLFVCVKNGGKSQMAAGLMDKVAGESVTTASAGSKPGSAVNDLSAQVLAEVGVDITQNVPRHITAEDQQQADLVVILGPEAQVDEVEGTLYERWNTDEPSDRGIDGIDRMRLVRDDILERVTALHTTLTTR
ncbi:low molecular weight phosphatase family protein [Arthrobacter sp. B1805]|uniref:arsenate-mycothiol transferase ArsC n=1 Tax=Arthrobacter sp. B1805 TaxID=2058892 RepID=UPI00215823A1|nr:low molecular weight phosphatase family protein [Arthrobacter sp. B1805]